MSHSTPKAKRRLALIPLASSVMLCSVARAAAPEPAAREPVAPEIHEPSMQAPTTVEAASETYANCLQSESSGEWVNWCMHRHINALESAGIQIVWEPMDYPVLIGLEEPPHGAQMGIGPAAISLMGYHFANDPNDCLAVQLGPGGLAVLQGRGVVLEPGSRTAYAVGIEREPPANEPLRTQAPPATLPVPSVTSPVLAEAPPAPPPPAPAPPPPPARSNGPAYVTLAIAGAALGVAAYFGVRDLKEQNDGDELIALLSGGIGFTIGVTGIVLLTSSNDTGYAQSPDRRNRIALGASPASGGGMVSGGLRF